MWLFKYWHWGVGWSEKISLTGDCESLIEMRGRALAWDLERLDPFLFSGVGFQRGFWMVSGHFRWLRSGVLLPRWVLTDRFMGVSLNGNVTTGAGRCGLITVLKGLVKFLGVLLLLYVFICSLDLLSNAFRLLGGKTAGQRLFRLCSASYNFSLSFFVSRTLVVKSRY